VQRAGGKSRSMGVKKEVLKKRRLNEKKFGQWHPLPNGGRQYFYVVEGRRGWKARYVKEVNRHEETVRFYQEIYDDTGKLVEVHYKFPEDLGHQKIKSG